MSFPSPQPVDGEPDVEVLVYRRPNLRDECLEYESFMGIDVLRSIFDQMKMRPDVTDLFLSFPERWLNIIEQRALYPRLAHYCPNLKSLQIKTHSVYIIQCTPSRCVKILEPQAGETIMGEDVPIDTKMYNKMVGNFFGNGLNIINGDGVREIVAVEQ